MALTDVYVQTYGQFPEFFRAIQDAQAPEQFTQQYLKDLGFASSNHRALIPLLKALGFLTADGVPTPRYHAYRDRSQARRVMAEALRDAYSDLFTIKAKPAEADRPLIAGKLKSAHNCSDRVAELQSRTFYALMPLADLEAAGQGPTIPLMKVEAPPATQAGEPHKAPPAHGPSLHYNIQVHLPATKDIEVYNAIFKSLRDHLLE